jgi:hypothetical protein
MIATLLAPDGTRNFVSVRATVLGVALDLRYLWNARTEHWTLDVSVDGVPLVYGQVLRPGKDLLARADVRLKPKVIMVVLWTDDIQRLDTPGLTDFAERAMVVVSAG